MRASFQNFQEVLAHLKGKGLFHMDLSLDRMRRALAALDLARPPFAVAQILGTNGKGSTATFLASLCTAHGCKTGLYTSPHFVSPEERIRVDGRPRPGDRWIAHADRILSVAADLTYFEFLTALALLIFRDERVDVAVLEAGLGGRHDATTAVAADLLCFTPIALDHKDVLGPSLGHIAADKAGAVRGPAPIRAAVQFPEAARRLEEAARAHGAPLLWAEPLPAPAPGGMAWAGPGLQGPHQLVNAGLALAAWQGLAPLLGKSADDVRAQAHGLAHAFLPGRLQSVPAAQDHPPLLLDGAHNPHGMRALLKALRQKNIRPAAAVFSCLGDKDWRTSALMLKHFLGAAPMFIPALGNPRAARANEVAAACNALPPATAVALENLPEALARSADVLGAGAKADPARPLLLTGSLYLLAEFFTLHPNLLEVPAPGPAPNSPGTAST